MISMNDIYVRMLEKKVECNCSANLFTDAVSHHPPPKPIGFSFHVAILISLFILLTRIYRQAMECLLVHEFLMRKGLVNGRDYLHAVIVITVKINQYILMLISQIGNANLHIMCSACVIIMIQLLCTCIINHFLPVDTGLCKYLYRISPKCRPRKGKQSM